MDLNRLWNKHALALVLAAALSACASTQTQENTATVNRDVARVQAETTPYDHLKTRLTMKAGPTFLGFMQDVMKPAMDKYMPRLDEVEAKYPKQYSKWQEIWLDAGDGVAVRIDDNNYYFNIGYRDGANDENDPKSGRSYGVGPTGRQSDPSYPYYLRELAKYFENEPGSMRDFYEAILLALVKNDPSGWRKLSEEGQTVATDFLAIYAAESVRHIMVDLHPGIHPWEIDLAAVTFASAYVMRTGKMMSDVGTLVEGDISQFNGQGRNGSGVGITRKERKKLTKLIASHLAEKNEDAQKAVKTMEKYIGDRTDDDMIQGLFEYLNAPGGKGPKKIANSDQLIEAMLVYMDQVSADARKIRQ